MVSEEPFMKYLREQKLVDMLKLRASYGEIGDDNVGGRWLYLSQWAYGGTASVDVDRSVSPYEWYRETSIGNADVHWEKAKKWNFGVDYGILGGLLTGSLDFFRDKRTDILIAGDKHSVPSYFGATPATMNLGVVKTRGYELTVRFNKVLANKMRFWADLNMTHATNEIVVKDDQPLLPSYRKEAGYAIGQWRSHIEGGFLRTYDDIYGAPRYDAGAGQRLPGDYYMVDFNGDGVVDKNDSAPYGYASQPQNTYNATIGWEWKGWSCFVQFYGVSNVTRDVTLTDFANSINTVYDQGTWWSKYEANADVPPSRWINTQSEYAYGSHYLYDGSFVRLKNAEVAYTFTQPWVKKIGLESLRLYVSGNNLLLWTKMPDDRESNLSGYSGSGGAYPTVRRVNFGIKLSL